MTEHAPQRAPVAHWPSAPDWELFHNNRAIWNAVLELCDAAKHSVRVEQYIIGVRGIGHRLLDLLADKARQGVDVQLLADGLGSYGLVRSKGGQDLLRNGGQIAMFNGVSDLVRSPIRRAHRLHRKTLICDGSTVMVGGSCYHERMATWRDTMIRIGGPLPPVIVAEFDRAFRMACDKPVERLSIAGDDRKSWSYGLSGPDLQGGPDLRTLLPEKIAQAQRSVSLTTPYLLPNRRLWDAMLCAVDRGAQVRILMPARSDHRTLDLIGQRFARALVRRGVQAQGYMPGMIHAKVALVDGTWSSVSSFNLDLFSGNLNLESGLITTSPDLYGALSEQWNIDWPRSEPL